MQSGAFKSPGDGLNAVVDRLPDLSVAKIIQYKGSAAGTGDI